MSAFPLLHHGQGHDLARKSRIEKSGIALSKPIKFHDGNGTAGEFRMG